MSDVVQLPPVSPLDLVLRAMCWWHALSKSLRPARLTGDPLSAEFLEAMANTQHCAVAAAPYESPRWEDGVGWTGPLPAPNELEDFPADAVAAVRAYQRAVARDQLLSWARREAGHLSRLIVADPDDDPPPRAA